MNNRDIAAARRFHEITKHSYVSVRSIPHLLDWENRPSPYKIYPEAETIALPRELSLSGASTLEALSPSSAASDDTPVDLAALTRILFLCDGITRRKKFENGEYHFRAAPSAGALYPVEVYVCAREVEGLEPGLYHFSPADLKLARLRRGDLGGVLARAAGMRPSLARARAIVVLGAIFWRSAWKYRARAYRYCFWDAGTLLANLLAAAWCERLATEVVTAFVDGEVEALLGLAADRECVVCMVALGRNGSPATAIPVIEPLGLESLVLSEREVVYDELVAIHQASRLRSADEARAVSAARLEPATAMPAPGRAIKPPTLAPATVMGLGETVLRRGSTRVFAREPISAEELATVMAASSAHPVADFPPLINTYLIVNAVGGLEPGAYHYRRETGAFELLKPGNFRGEAGFLCLEQALGADASALVVYMADLERALGTLGNRAYRDVHLEAGIRGGRAYLAAYALGRGATGLTFYDDDTTRFFSPHAKDKSPILMVAVGVPRAASAPTHR